MPEIAGDAAVEVVGMNAGGPAVSELLFQAASGEFQPGVVEIGAAGVQAGTPDQRRKALEKRHGRVRWGGVLNVGGICHGNDGTKVSLEDCVITAMPRRF